MRRLPIYIVVDVSESMVGNNHEYLQEGLNTLIRTLRTDPYALETVHISLIAFAGKVETLVPLTELFSFYPTKLPMGAGTRIGEAINHLIDEIQQNVQSNTTSKKGDYKPIVYFMTDGTSTDDTTKGIARWQKEIGNSAKFIGIGIGRFANLSLFQELTNEVLRVNDTKEKDFKNFIDWISQSVSAQSRSVGTGSDVAGVSLEKVDDDVIKLIKNYSEAKPVDENYVIFTGLCSKTELPYLLKYEHIDIDSPPEAREFYPNMPQKVYEFRHVIALNYDYKRWSDTDVNINTVNVQSLVGSGDCPHCYANHTIAQCSICFNIMCIPGPGVVTCPHCHNEQEFIVGDANFEINRSRG